MFAGLHVECLVPRIHVANRDGAILIGRVPVGDYLLTQRGFARLGAPALRKADEELLITREAVDNRRRLAIERQLPGVIRDREPGQVGNVLTQHLLTVEREIRERPVLVVLLRELLGSFLEVREVFRLPPVVEFSGGVELCALVVEAVADLVADDRAHRAVVHHHRTIRVEVRWLEDRRREVHRVHHREIHGVDGLRRHDPLGTVHGLAQFGEIPLRLELLGAQGIAERIARADVERGVVYPPIGIADADLEHGEFRLRFRLGLRRHPVELVDAA